MRSKLHICAAIVAVAVAALGVFYPPPSGAGPLHPPAPLRLENPAPQPFEDLIAASNSSCWNYKPTERRFARFQNSERAEEDIDKLRLDPELSKAARLHTRRMVRADDLFHTPTDKLTRRVRGWTLLGENVGVGGSVESLHAAFMASPGHEANILWSTFRHVGIGVRESDDRMWVTVIFQAAKNPGTSLRMPSC